MRLPLFAARDAGQALSALFEDCDRDERCRAAFPKIADRAAALIARLDKTPLETPVTHPRTGTVESVEVTARVVANGILAALYSSTTGAILPALLDRAERNDFQPLLALALAGDDENMAIGMQLSVLCSEDASQFSEADTDRETSGRLLGRHLLAGQLLACRMWPKGHVPPGYFQPVETDVPALVLSGALDPVTPSSWGAEVVQHLTRGRHLVAAETGHGVAQTPCGARLVAEFIATGDAVGLDAGCLERGARPPFFISPSGPDPLAGDVGTAP